MAHFAQLDENNMVVNVIVVSNDDCGGGEFPESEAPGREFIASLGLAGTWKQTSYNSNFRKHYAGIGFKYDETRDIFIANQPFASWVLNEETAEWEAPVARPDGPNWIWNETEGEWQEVTA